MPPPPPLLPARTPYGSRGNEACALRLRLGFAFGTVEEDVVHDIEMEGKIGSSGGGKSAFSACATWERFS
jgi:hypothetical protein